MASKKCSQPRAHIVRSKNEKKKVNNDKRGRGKMRIGDGPFSKGKSQTSKECLSLSEYLKCQET